MKPAVITTVLATSLLLVGCEPSDSTIKRMIAKGVNFYCTVLAESRRQALREDIAELIAPHKLIWQCHNDTE